MMRAGRLAISTGLERGTLPGLLGESLTSLLERGWNAAARHRVARPLRVPAGLKVVTVGGATLGGSGKTSVAIACARYLAAEGARVALIGHAYAARPGRARVVSVDDPHSVVGDEALVCAREVAGLAVDVVVAPSRQRAVDFAVTRGARLLVIDGPLQLSPRRADLSLLALDGERPWGGDACPPRGDRRAPKDALLAAADHVVWLGSRALSSRGAIAGGGRFVSFAELASLRSGLAVTLARPERLLGWLARHGVHPRLTVRGADHRGFGRSQLAEMRCANDIDVWLTTCKCAIHLESRARLPAGVRLWPLDFSIQLENETKSALASLVLRSRVTSLDPPAPPP